MLWKQGTLRAEGFLYWGILLIQLLMLLSWLLLLLIRFHCSLTHCVCEAASQPPPNALPQFPHAAALPDTAPPQIKAGMSPRYHCLAQHDRGAPVTLTPVVLVTSCSQHPPCVPSLAFSAWAGEELEQP